jgi:hypothetical protein
MGRKFCITEEQYKRLMKEGVAPSSKFTVQANNYGDDDPAKNVQRTQQELKNVIPNADKNFQVVANNPKSPDTQIVSKNNSSQTDNTTVSEGKFITKKQLQENRLKEMKKNSEVYTVKDFINKFQ